MIYGAALALFEALWNGGRAVRLLGVGTSNLCQPARQLRLFEQAGQRQAQLDSALDRIRDRFGRHAIQRASLLEPPDELWVGRTREE
jgi:DNA polymerase-4